MHGRQAAASRLTAAAHYTGREGEKERNGVEAGDIPRGGQKGVARAREKSRGEFGPTDRPVNLAVKSALLKRERERYTLRET